MYRSILLAIDVRTGLKLPWWFVEVEDIGDSQTFKIPHIIC